MFFSLFFALFRYLSLLFEHFRSFPDQITGYSWINLSFSLFFWPKYCNLVSVSVRLCCGTINYLIFSDLFCVMGRFSSLRTDSLDVRRAWTAPEPTMKFRVKSYRRNFVRVSFEIHSNDGDPNWSLQRPVAYRTYNDVSNGYQQRPLGDVIPDSSTVYYLVVWR